MLGVSVGLGVEGGYAEDVSAEDVSAEDVSAEDVSAEDVSAEAGSAEAESVGVCRGRVGRYKSGGLERVAGTHYSLTGGMWESIQKSEASKREGGTQHPRTAKFNENT